MIFSASRNILAAIALVLLSACGGSAAEDQAARSEVSETKPKLGLFTTLPIYWGEGDFGAILDGTSKPDWVRTELESRFELVPLDTLEADALEGLDRVLLAQPRPLAPSENVAFDAFLAGGGRAVIMADPMLTRHSGYRIGDKRRPQDVVLLSPIFDRLGIELRFDEDQEEGERVLRQSNVDFPVNLAGQFVAKDTGEPSRRCHALEDGLIAQCVNGEGEAYLFADAALLDWEWGDPVPAKRKQALWRLLDPLLPEPQN
ncbi:GldG family protein [Qipengyuania sphaerica]|uniref:GldG family protein n=1 Tax=Qipengyuania sphaerica TaxID=2867243 RepID=UPI001C88134B|nr:GldG family protein [Qipengyuania sphaerica]MBX7540016.1 GldG family protein [Qipengyuania sphaerica]